MSHEALLQVLARVMLVCVAIVAIIDVLSEFQIKPAIRLKWSAFWFFCRYIAMICAIVLALDVLNFLGE